MAKKYEVMTGKHVIDPMTGRPMAKGRPVPNAGASKPDAVGPNDNMPSGARPSRKKPWIKTAPDTPENRHSGSVGRVLDPSGGRVLDGPQGAVMRKGYPMNAPHDNTLRSKITSGLNRLGDTFEGMDQQLMGPRKKRK